MYAAKRYPKSRSLDPLPTWQRMSTLTLGLVSIVLSSGCAAPLQAGPGGSANPPQATPDAIFRVYEQHWTLAADGSSVYHEKTHVQLNSDRVFGEFGDARIFYNKDTDKVEVLVARTKMVDGRYVDLADYSTVEVAPDDTAGWPAFGNLTQMVQVMGGIEPGCIVEREYKVITKAGVRPYLEGDVRIDADYPVVSRIVSVTLPNGVELAPVVTGLAENQYTYSFEQGSDGRMIHRWEFAGLEAQPGEAQSLPWRVRGVRLAFTTAAGVEAWVKQKLAEIDRAASENPLASQLAREWTKDAGTPSEQLKVLREKFAETFNFANFNVAWQPAAPRPAAEVLSGCYGLPAESAAAFLALARAVGLAMRPALLVDDDAWDDKAPQAAMVSEYVLLFDAPDGLEIWHPRHGRIQRDARWSGYSVIFFTADKLSYLALPPWKNPDDSKCWVTGSVTISPERKYSGKVTVRTSGLFVSPRQMQTNSDQKRMIGRIVGSVLPKVKVKDFTLKTLTNDSFEAEAAVESDGELEKAHELILMTLAHASPALNDASIPTGYTRRLGPARLTGPFDEKIELSVEWPDKWQVAAVPTALAEVKGDWGFVVQSVTPSERGLQLQRRLRVNQRDLAPEFVDVLRKQLIELRTPYAHTILWKP